jgi:phosphotriesterase-related protein
MPTVPTVLGPVDVDDLGPTLMHEHIFIVDTEHLQNYGVGHWWDEEQRVADAVRKLTLLRDRGIRTIVDMTVQGLGRYIPRIKRVAEQVPGLNIIASTGFYTFTSLPEHYARRGPGLLWDVPEPLVTDFMRDLTEGVADTGVRAGMLKCCVESQGLLPDVERVARAVAAAHRETGAPITVHTDSESRSGLLALQVFKEESVDLSKVVIGHAGDSTDLEYLREIADAGAILGMDRFGLSLYRSTEERVKTVAQLAELGYADRMVISHDAHCFMDYMVPDPIALETQFTPDWHYLHISDDVLPMLRMAGVTEQQIEQMLVTNPRQLFTSAWN